MRGPFKIELMPCDKAGSEQGRQLISHVAVVRVIFLCAKGHFAALEGSDKRRMLSCVNLGERICRECTFFAMNHAKLCKLIKPYSEHSSALDLIREGSDKKQGPFSPPEPGSWRNSMSCECF